MRFLAAKGAVLILAAKLGMAVEQQQPVATITVCAIDSVGCGCQFVLPTCIYSLLGEDADDLRLTTRVFTAFTTVATFVRNLIGLLKAKQHNIDVAYERCRAAIELFFTLNGGKQPALIAQAFNDASAATDFSVQSLGIRRLLYEDDLTLGVPFAVSRNSQCCEATIRSTGEVFVYKKLRIDGPLTQAAVLEEFCAGSLLTGEAAVVTHASLVCDVAGVPRGMLLRRVAGGTLLDFYAAVPFAFDAAFSAALLGLATAINEAHIVGIVHRDIKADNVLVEAATDGSLSFLLADFGVASRCGSLSPLVFDGDETTAAYAPELRDIDAIHGPPTDWFGFGALIETILQRCVVGVEQRAAAYSLLYALIAGTQAANPEHRFTWPLVSQYLQLLAKCNVQTDALVEVVFTAEEAKAALIDAVRVTLQEGSSSSQILALHRFKPTYFSAFVVLPKSASVTLTFEASRADAPEAAFFPIAAPNYFAYLPTKTYVFMPASAAVFRFTAASCFLLSGTFNFFEKRAYAAENMLAVNANILHSIAVFLLPPLSHVCVQRVNGLQPTQLLRFLDALDEEAAAIAK